MTTFHETYGFDVDGHTLFLGVTGSHAYGMARPDSDVDIRGVCLPPRRIRESYYRSFEQYTTTQQKGTWGPISQKAIDVLLQHETAGECYRRSDPFSRCEGTADLCIYGLHKFVSLASANNPNILELMFLDVRDALYSHPKWERLLEFRDMFLSRKCRHTYLGYALSQLKRIKSHREWLLRPPSAPPTRSEYGLREESVLSADVRNLIDENILRTLREWSVEDGLDAYIRGSAQDTLRDRMVEFQATVLQCSEHLLNETLYDLAGVKLGLSEEVRYAIKQERRYRTAHKQWKAFQKWKTERNEDRAALEAQFGYDTKHASHLVRLLRMGAEILRGEGVRVRRDDAEEIIAVRSGVWDYDELMAQVQQMQDEIKEATKNSPLPAEPPYEKLDETLLELLDV